MHSVRVRRESQKLTVIALVLTTSFYKKMIGLVLCGVLIACDSLKTMTTDKIYQRIDYNCMLIHTLSLIWPATRSHYLSNFGLDKIGPCTIKLSFIMYFCIYNNDKASQR